MRTRRSVLVVLVAFGAAACAGGSSKSAQSGLTVATAAPATTAGLHLVADQPTATATIDASGQAFLTVPVSLVAGDRPFEVRAVTDHLGGAIVATLTNGGTAGTPKVLDPTLVPDWKGLAGFVTLDVLDTSGATVRHDATTFCPNRTARPAAVPTPAAAPAAPDDCSGNPFHRSAVWQIAPHASSALLGSGVSLPLPPGSYDLRVGLGPTYAALVGRVDPLTIKLTVSAGAPVSTAPPATGGADSGFGAAAREPIEGVVPPSAPAPAVAPASGPLPDLEVLPAYDLTTGYDEATQRDLAAFAVSAVNVGTAPLTLRFDGLGLDPSASAITQQLAADPSAADRPVTNGALRADTGTWALPAAARYELVTEGGKVVRSAEEAWTFAPTDPNDLARDDADWTADPVTALAALDRVGGSATNTVEHLPVGWAVTYSHSAQGQGIDITGLPNGSYTLRITVDPSGRLSLLGTGSRVSTRQVVLGGVDGVRTIWAAPVGSSTVDDVFPAVGFGAGAVG